MPSNELLDCFTLEDWLATEEVADRFYSRFLETSNNRCIEEVFWIEGLFIIYKDYIRMHCNKDYEILTLYVSLNGRVAKTVAIHDPMELPQMILGIISHSQSALSSPK